MTQNTPQVSEMIEWRHMMHATPEIGFEEVRTAQFVCDKLRSFGVDEVVEGVGGTGIVASLHRGDGGRSVGLRADMDALRIQEDCALSYKSKRDGYMHACGHDGHMAMLLGAAKALVSHDDLNGIVRFIFQPAEEWGNGASAMLEDGLLTRFPFDEVYGVHIWPGLPVGQVATRSGPFMASEDNFEIVIEGRGGHAARPHQSRDPLVAACAIVSTLQTIVSRLTDPADTVVVSVTEVCGDGTRNVLPGRMYLRGDCRSYSSNASSRIKHKMTEIAEGISKAYGCTASITYTTSFISLNNDAQATDNALRAARKIGLNTGGGECPLMTASDDFARFLERVPGCYLLLGNGEDSPPLHNPRFDFNDEALGAGADLFVELARQCVGPIA